MNCQLKLTLIFIAVISSIVFSQDDITLYEGKSSEVCGKIVIFDGIWISAGQQFADISVLEIENSKPITGGYSMYDKIDFGYCTYYVTGIYKNGINPQGRVKLSIKKPERLESIKFGQVVVKDGEKIYTNDPLSIIKIKKDSTGNPVVLTSYIEYDIVINVTLRKGSIIWFDGFPFEIAEISIENKTVEFLTKQSYSYSK